jgi:cell division protein FtsI (penicillin-binding protein 3)
MGFAPVMNPQLVIVVTLNGTAGDNGMGGAAAGPVFKAIATEALRMMDVPKDIPEDIADTKKPNKKDKVVEEASVADLGGSSIMAEDQTVKELLADEEKLKQLAAAEKAAEIPAAAGTDAPTLAFAPPAPAPVVPKGPTVPDYLGKSMRAVVEEASADGIEVMIEGTGVARAQVPMPGKPLRRGERIRVVFTR